jgi:hypothetical protein
MSESTAKMYRVACRLSVFSNETDELIADYPFSSFDLLKFKQHFGVPDEDEDTEMYCEYTVGPKDSEFLSQHLDEVIDFDFEKYTYFVSCHRVDG